MAFLKMLALTQVFILPAAVIQNLVQGGTLAEHLVVSIPFIFAGQLIQMTVHKRRNRCERREEEEGPTTEEDVRDFARRVGIPVAAAGKYLHHMRRDPENPCC